MTITKKAYDVNAAAEASSCSVDQIRAAISAGKLQARKPGKSYLILEQDLEEWLTSLPVVN